MTVPGPFTMAQQAQNDFYEHEEEVAFAYADAIREEILDLFAAGADIVQLDEPWMEAAPEQARRYAVETVQRALDGVTGTTALHICFGYPSFVPEHRPRYEFLAELAAAPVDQISIETARPTSTSRCSTSSPTRRSSSACSRSTRPTSRRPRRWPSGSAARCPTSPAPARGRPGLRDEVPAARRGLRQAAGARGRRAAGQRRGGDGLVSAHLTRDNVDCANYLLGQPNP
jgi:hypothetical protein